MLFATSWRPRDLIVLSICSSMLGVPRGSLVEIQHLDPRKNRASDARQTSSKRDRLSHGEDPVEGVILLDKGNDLARPEVAAAVQEDLRERGDQLGWREGRWRDVPCR